MKAEVSMGLAVGGDRTSGPWGSGVPFTRSGRLSGHQDVGFLFVQCVFYDALLSPYLTNGLVAIFLKHLRTKSLTYASSDCGDGITGVNMYPNSPNCIQ